MIQDFAQVCTCCGVVNGHTSPNCSSNPCQQCSLLVCYNCNQPEHIWRDCPQRQLSTCFHCGQFRCRERPCPQWTDHHEKKLWCTANRQKRLNELTNNTVVEITEEEKEVVITFIVGERNPCADYMISFLGLTSRLTGYCVSKHRATNRRPPDPVVLESYPVWGPQKLPRKNWKIWGPDKIADVALRAIDQAIKELQGKVVTVQEYVYFFLTHGPKISRCGSLNRYIMEVLSFTFEMFTRILSDWRRSDVDSRAIKTSGPVGEAILIILRMIESRHTTETT